MGRCAFVASWLNTKMSRRPGRASRFDVHIRARAHVSPRSASTLRGTWAQVVETYAWRRSAHTTSTNSSRMRHCALEGLCRWQGDETRSIRNPCDHIRAWHGSHVVRRGLPSDSRVWRPRWHILRHAPQKQSAQSLGMDTPSSIEYVVCLTWRGLSPTHLLRPHGCLLMGLLNCAWQ